MKTINECADRIEAGELFFREHRLTTIANQLRNGEFHILTLGYLRRECERLLDAAKVLDRIVAEHQGRKFTHADSEGE